MCLACELEALWYGEGEPPAAGTTGLPSVLAGEPRRMEIESAASFVQAASRSEAEAAGAGGTSAAAARPPFLGEETE
jgi:hypothetical protein